jgi:hypothetical protein
MAPQKHPQATRPSLLTVYDGRTCVGHLIRRGKTGVEAFDVGDRSIGIFKSASDAADAVTAAFARSNREAAA